jgi:hypothetical protein
MKLVGFSLLQRYHAYHRGLWDFSPSTRAGKIFTMFYIFVGIGIILGFVNAVAERSMEQRSRIRRLLERRSRGEGLEREED